MSKIKSFTLIELIIVIIIFGITSYLVFSNIKTTIHPLITPDKFREVFLPTGNLYIFRNKIYNDKNITNISITNPIVYDKNLKQIIFNRYKDKEVLFKYSIKNGIQNSYILECNEGIFVFKPLYTIKVNSLKEAQKLFSLEKYLPTDGNYYK